MSISACAQHDVKRKQQTASSPARQQKLREVVWRRRADDGSELTFDPTVITRDEAGAFIPMRRVAQSTSSRNITVNVWSQLDTCVHELELALRLKALADPARIQLISILMAARPGEVSTGDLAEAVGLSSATVSHHLGQLKKAGLVSSERRGINVLYRAEPDALEALRAVLATCC